MIVNKDLKRRIIEISYKHKLSHLGSCLTTVDLIKEIYDEKNDDEKFVLSAGHSGLALYVVLESIYPRVDAEEYIKRDGIHPDRNNESEEFIDCSTGSLGHGLPIAIGMALSDRNKNVYCMISDGECGEGSISESLRIMAEHEINNLYVYINDNGYSAYDRTVNRVRWLLYSFPSLHSNMNHKITNCDYLPFLKGLEGHYHIMNENEYDFALGILG